MTTGNGNGNGNGTAEELYGKDDDIATLAKLVRKIAPWANDKNYPMSDTEIGLVCRRAIGMSLDPLNPHELQIWKDRRGNINFQLAYTLLRQWAHQIHGGHTEPRYIRLTDEELSEQGLSATDIAYRCEFVMKEDIPLIATMLSAGWDATEARESLTVCGIGTATAQEFGAPYFAPAARSKVWKVQKRAYTDALRTRLGTPNQADIEKMRRLRGEEHITPADWQLAAGETGEARARLAAMAARERTREPDDREPDEILAENNGILHGDEDGEI